MKSALERSIVARAGWVRGRLGQVVDRVLWRTTGSSSRFWDAHYRLGGTSGPGSHGELRAYKAGYINAFIQRQDISSVIEFGCGDGEQLSSYIDVDYVGLDVSEVALRRAMDRFVGDSGKSFFIYEPALYRDNHGLFRCELALSIDVIFHLVENEIYSKYLSDLFSSSTRWVIVYTSNEEQLVTDVPYTRHRHFIDDVERLGSWQLVHAEENPLASLTRARFFVFERMA